MSKDVGIGQKYCLDSKGRKVMTIWWSDQPHPSGDTKVCVGCGTTILRKRRHKPAFWARMLGCSYGCMSRSRSLPLEEKLANFIPDPLSGCHIWQGTTTNQGIPRAIIWFKGKLSIAVRVMWEFYKGPIPDGLLCCHECDNGLCVNLDHIFLGTTQDNMADMARKGRSARMRGSKSGKAKLNEIQVLAIMREPGSDRDVALKYGVAKETIDGIRRGRRWGWLTEASSELEPILPLPEEMRRDHAA